MNLKFKHACIIKAVLILILLVVAIYNLNAVSVLNEPQQADSLTQKRKQDEGGEARESTSLQDEQCAMTSTTPDSRGGIQLFQTVEIYPPPRPTPTPTPKVFNMIFLFVLTVSGRMPMSYDRC
jgi:hypothetical protein